ncbi:hypothetical protein [Streptomyces sp. NPDC046332]|uniref:hypothetical protein n=1 Tax=Streptomyces sp. NPDC046332 TaxID=3155133 RepID=UPI003401126A
MPGQRKRKRHRSGTERFAPASGHWSVLFETQDESEWRVHVQRLRAPDTRIDWSAVRIDTFCGRLERPTTYRLSLVVPHT